MSVHQQQKIMFPPDHGQQIKDHTQKDHQEDEGDHTNKAVAHIPFSGNHTIMYLMRLWIPKVVGIHDK